MSVRTVSSDSLLQLVPGQVDLWYTRTDQVTLEFALQYQELLTPEELSQYRRYYFEKDRHRYLVTRALVREVLSRYMPVTPEAWRFGANRYGRPYVVDPVGVAEQIDFNISHTDGLIVLGVCHGKVLGVDAENTRRAALLDVADRYFSASESNSLRSLPLQYQPTRFWELWTLKESYIKARGMGLSLPLDQFSFDLDMPRGISIDFAPGFDDQPSRWQFWQLRPTRHHLLSICTESSTADDYPAWLNLREIVPLSSHWFVRCPLDRFSSKSGLFGSLADYK